MLDDVAILDDYGLGASIASGVVGLAGKLH